MDSILIVIPAFNAESSVAQMIGQIRFHLKESSYVHEILLVDDGSTDDTSRMAKELGVTLIRHLKNLGKGEALKTSFRHAVLKQYPTIVTIDADLQHNPASLPSMLTFFMNGKYDIVIGARTFDRGKMSLNRIMSNRITSLLISIRANQPILDSQSGYRIIRTEAIRNITLRTSRFETESEILIRLAQKNGRIGFYPVDTIYAGEKSNIRHIQDTLRFITMYIRTIFN